MKMKNPGTLLVLAPLLLVAALRAQTPVNPAYTITDLGTLGGTFSAGYGVNNSGEVTGEARIAGNGANHAFLYANGSMSDLGTLGGTNSFGYGINDAGQVTGLSWTTTTIDDTHAFLYTSGGMSDLGTLGGANSYGYGINNAGQVTGYSLITGDGADHAFLYAGGSMSDLGTLGGANSFGSGINGSGQVAGYSQITGSSTYHAFLYANGSMSDLGTLGGANSYGNGINDAGQVTGYSQITGSSASHAFLYAGGSMSDLGTLGGTSSVGLGINGSGQVAGYSLITGNSVTHAFLYSGGTMSDLNNLVGANPVATDIALNSNDNHPLNDWGQVAAYGTVGSQRHALLLNPVDPLTSVAGAGRDTKFVAGMSYGKFTPTTNAAVGSLGTTVSLLGGTAGSGSMGAYGLNRDVVMAFQGTDTAKFASDFANITGTDGDTYVLQLTYSEAQILLLAGAETAARLDWYDPATDSWKNAVDGNTGGLAHFIDGAYDPGYTLGAYGIDIGTHTVWAVVNHGGTFAAVPEPAAGGAAVAAILGLAAALRFRKSRLPLRSHAAAGEVRQPSDIVSAVYGG